MSQLEPTRSPGALKGFNSRWGNHLYNKSPKIRRSSIPACSPTAMNFLKRRSSCFFDEPKEKETTTAPMSLRAVTMPDFIESKLTWQPILAVLASETIASILEKLGQNKQNIATVVEDNGSVLGTIDIMDLVSVCYNVIKSSTDMDSASLDCREAFHKETARSFLTAGHGCPLVSVFAGSPLIDVIQLITAPIYMKRVAVLKPFAPGVRSWEDIAVVLSDSDVLHYVSQNPQLVSKDLTASQCPSTEHADTDITADNVVKDKYLIASSLKTMWNKQITGGAVSHGHSFLDKFTNWMTHIITADLPLEDLIVQPQEPAFGLLKTFLYHNIDRVFIMEEDAGPYRQLRAADVLRCLLESGEISLKREL